MPRVRLDLDFDLDDDFDDADELGILDDDEAYLDGKTTAKIKRRDNERVTKMVVDGMGLKKNLVNRQVKKKTAQTVRERGFENL